MKTKLFPYIKFYNRVTSTNTLALDLLQEHAVKNNFAICAREQTGGKGRQQRSWYSPPGGLYCTLGFPNTHFPSTLTLFTGFVIHKVLQSTFRELTFHIKWPNDLYLNDKKVGGILTSSSDFGTIIGIGIDCNITTIPEHLKDIATSLLIESGKKISVKKLLEVLLKTFESNLHIFEEEGFSYFKKYFGDVHYLTGRQIRTHSINNEICGIVQGITNEGALTIETEKGTQDILSSEKIDILR